MAVTSDDLVLIDSSVSEHSPTWQCPACTLINSTSVDYCRACHGDRPVGTVATSTPTASSASETITDTSSTPPTGQGARRPLVGKGSIGSAFIGDTGRLLSKSAKSVANATVTNDISDSSIEPTARRPLVGKGSIGSAFIGDTGRFISKSAKSVANATVSNNSSDPSTGAKKRRPLVGKGSIGSAFIGDSGRFISKSAKSAANKAKDTAHVVSEKTKDVCHTHDINGKSQRAVAKTKQTAGVAKDKCMKLDEQINLTGIVTGLATFKAAKHLIHGQGKSSAVALGVAGASLATKKHFNEERARQNGNGGR